MKFADQIGHSSQSSQKTYKKLKIGVLAHPKR